MSASGDVKPVVFYAISLFILALMLSAIPVSGFLQPLDPVLRRQLLLAGVGPVSMILSRILGLALLYMVLLLSAASAAVLTGAVPFPSAFQKAAPFLPPYIFIETVKMAVTAHWEPWIFAALPAVFLAGALISLAFEVKRP